VVPNGSVGAAPVGRGPGVFELEQQGLPTSLATNFHYPNFHSFKVWRSFMESRTRIVKQVRVLAVPPRLFLIDKLEPFKACIARRMFSGGIGLF